MPSLRDYTLFSLPVPALPCRALTVPSPAGTVCGFTLHGGAAALIGRFGPTRGDCLRFLGCMVWWKTEKNQKNQACSHRLFTYSPIQPCAKIDMDSR